MSVFSRITGVTVGVGPTHEMLAPLAALCFTANTGLPVRILGAKEFARSGVSHPAALRFQLFDYTDADTAIYFDADWFCVQSWQPWRYANHAAFIACRDFVLESEWPHQKYDYSSTAFHGDEISETIACDEPLREDYITAIRHFSQIKRTPKRWINSGLFIATREPHETLFRRANELYETTVGHHADYYEQPALNKALEDTDIKLGFLSRKHNVLAAYEHRWPHSIVGLHVKIKRHEEFVGKVKSGEIADADAVRRHFF